MDDEQASHVPPPSLPLVAHCDNGAGALELQALLGASAQGARSGPDRSRQRYVRGPVSLSSMAFSEPDDEDYHLDEPLPYVALGDTRIWLEDNALDISIRPIRATVRPEHRDAFRRFWNFIEAQAHRGNGDKGLETLLQIECFEGVGWVDDVLEYLGRQTRVCSLMHSAGLRVTTTKSADEPRKAPDASSAGSSGARSRFRACKESLAPRGPTRPSWTTSRRLVCYPRRLRNSRLAVVRSARIRDTVGDGIAAAGYPLA
jgi:hypothetical protein